MDFLQSELLENLSTERKRNDPCSSSTRDFQMLRSRCRGNFAVMETPRTRRECRLLRRSADAEEKQERRNCYYVSFRVEYLYSTRGAFRCLVSLWYSLLFSEVVNVFRALPRIRSLRDVERRKSWMISMAEIFKSYPINLVNQ